MLREAFLALKPGGRSAVSDVASRDEIHAEIRKSVLLWVGCVAGAFGEKDYCNKLPRAGFKNLEIEPTRIHRGEDARKFLAGQNFDADAIAPGVDGKNFSACLAISVLPTFARPAPTCAPFRSYFEQKR